VEKIVMTESGGDQRRFPKKGRRTYADNAETAKELGLKILLIQKQISRREHIIYQNCSKI